MKNAKLLYVLQALMLLLVLIQPFQGPIVGASDTIYVPGDFITIQEAIDNATSGDTIIVSNGRYKENIEVDKSLTIQGAHKSTTLIDGMQSGDTVQVTADDVVLTGFTVYNSSDDGVYITGDNVTVASCNIRKNYKGMRLYYANYSNIVDCSIYNCTWAGIEASRSHYATISGCDFYDLDTGLSISQSNGCLVNGSELHHGERGVNSHLTINLSIIDCDIYNQTGYEASYFEDSDGLIIDNCRFDNNSVNEAIELEACDGFIISATEVHDNGDKGIDLGSCQDGTITHCTVYDNQDTGIQCSYSERVTIEKCQVYDNTDYTGIYVGLSNLIWLIDVESTENSDGVRMSGADRVTICNSSFTGNSDDGIDLDACTKTYITDSRIINNYDGIEHDYSQSVITCSNFSDNYRGMDIINSRLSMRYCSFENNTFYSVWGDSPSNTNAILCWWGNASGPYHWLTNPSGTGEQVSDYVEYDPWQTELYQPEALISKLRCELRNLNWRVTYPDQVTPKPLGCGAALTSDWLASAFVTTKLQDIAEGLDTDSNFVDQATGEPIGDSGTGILTFGGPFVNPIVKRAENHSTPSVDRAPVRFHSGGDTFYFQYSNGTNIPNASLPLSVINNDEDLFVIERYVDGDGRLITICYGFGWPGTYAAGKYFDREVFPNLGRYTNSWVILHWEDTNGDGFVNNPGEGDTYTIIATGN